VRKCEIRASALLYANEFQPQESITLLAGFMVQAVQPMMTCSAIWYRVPLVQSAGAGVDAYLLGLSVFVCLHGLLKLCGILVLSQVLRLLGCIYIILDTLTRNPMASIG
jgi:hypothetical protein